MNDNHVLVFVCKFFSSPLSDDIHLNIPYVIVSFLAIIPLAKVCPVAVSIFVYHDYQLFYSFLVVVSCDWWIVNACRSDVGWFIERNSGELRILLRGARFLLTRFQGNAWVTPDPYRNITIIYWTFVILASSLLCRWVPPPDTPLTTILKSCFPDYCIDQVWTSNCAIIVYVPPL